MSKAIPGMHNLQMRLPEELYKALKARADKEGESAATLIRIAIKQYLKEEK